MGVGADDAVTGGDYALLGQQRMLDAHLAHVIEVADAVGAGEFSALLGLLGGLDVLIGDEMVQNDGDLVLIKDGVETGLGELIDGHGGGDVVAQDDVQLCADQLSGNHVIQAGVGRQDLLCHCHSHSVFLTLGSYCCTRSAVRRYWRG